MAKKKKKEKKNRVAATASFKCEAKGGGNRLEGREKMQFYFNLAREGRELESCAALWEIGTTKKSKKKKTTLFMVER